MAIVAPSGDYIRMANMTASAQVCLLGQPAWSAQPGLSGLLSLCLVCLGQQSSQVSFLWYSEHFVTQEFLLLVLLSLAGTFKVLLKMLLYRVYHQVLTQSKDLAWPDVLTNLPKTDAQGLPKQWKFMLDPSFETFLSSHILNSLQQKKVLKFNMRFDDSVKRFFFKTTK